MNKQPCCTDGTCSRCLNVEAANKALRARADLITHIQESLPMCCHMDFAYEYIPHPREPKIYAFECQVCGLFEIHDAANDVVYYATSIPE